MTLNVPLTVRVGDRHITREVQALAFTEDAVGGIQSISFKVARPLTELDADLAAFSTVSIYDGRSAECIAQGTLTDTGRSATAGDGQVWEVTAFGPAQHASDVPAPLVYIDQQISDGWRQVDRNKRAVTIDMSSLPSNSSDNSPDGIVAHFPSGTPLGTGDSVTLRYETIRECGQYLARYSYDWDAGATDGDYRARVITSVDGSGGGAGGSTVTFDTGGGSNSDVVVTDFANGRNVLDLVADYTGAGVTPGNDSRWFCWYNIIIRARLVDQDGTDITTGYTTDYVLAHQVVKDLLGRLLPAYDGANASVDTGAAHQIDALTFVDGATPAEILDDLMGFEPGYRWTTGPDTTGGGYSFSWEAWPTTVRYEATLDDGGSFPVSWQEVYDRVTVRWRDKRGRVRSTRRTYADVGLPDPGLPNIRRAYLDVGDDIHSAAGAQRRGDNFLRDHNVPANAGTLTVNRPVRDLQTGRMVEPFEIRAGELIRVRGVESYPDALNASSSDGQTVFRIWSKTYASDGNTATLELDSYSRTTANAIAKLAKRRSRKR